MPCNLSERPDVQEPHLNIVKDSIGNFFVEVAQGADRIIITPPLWSTNDAIEALKRIRSATGLNTSEKSF
jgi:hypothetical protein